VPPLEAINRSLLLSTTLDHLEIACRHVDRMPKRQRVGDFDEGHSSCAPSSKRARIGPRRNLLDISDEILLRILSYLPTQDLLRTERYEPETKTLICMPTHPSLVSLIACAP
jgi:hypothetical protein